MCSLLLALLTAPAGWAATYHVSPSGNDGNPGTLVAPWATFTKANTVLVAGDTAIIHAGTYSGQRIEPVHSGSPGHYITYKGATDEAMPVVTASPSLSIPGERPPVRRVAIVLNGNHHIWIEGLKISGGAARPPEGAGPNIGGWAVLYGASYNVVKDNYFEYAYGWTGFRLNGGSAFNRVIGNTMRVAGTYDNGLRPVSANDVMGAELLQISTGSNFNLLMHFIPLLWVVGQRCAGPTNPSNRPRRASVARREPRRLAAPFRVFFFGEKRV